MIKLAVKKRTYTILIVIFTIVFVLSSALFFFTVFDREKAKQDFDELAELVVIP